ncbi:2-amino-3,7-dideoxy-D-threo-hept-6-ulosonate synthase [Streptomyces formicae]|uniref:2-amino-3,7-dideoxy-D-threo-hept-6-ulosonate synthase n=1 Tax=Streptomyces formicae TaxID=1616117 RepID=A0A291QIX5_9ACTN|nr:2-amino-3,7-dideoxy-D-threo-hept-6-ulosonate synthase [Streptomyces formicae]ATL31750.1 2-amino-3,7-dideoxy-D-threo-hept-6-ulosonate synthase [Streptomyces formicae]
MTAARTRFGGKELRMSRLSRRADERYLFIPLDHSVSDGPVADAVEFDRLLGRIVAGGADAVIVHKGRAPRIDPRHLRSCALIVHLSAGTVHAADENAKVLVGGVEDAVRLGADAVSVHVNVGSETEAAQLADLGRIATECQHWNLPLLAMIYPRGPRIADACDPGLLSHVVNIAVDLGADLVKTSAAAPLHRMAEVVASCPVPVLVAGGPENGADLSGYARAVLDAGCAGLAVGRRVFTSADPERLVRDLAETVHAPRDLTDLPSPVAGLYDTVATL